MVCCPNSCQSKSTILKMLKRISEQYGNLVFPHTLEAFAQEMAGIYSTSVGADTLDECPMAYKPMESILTNVEPTVEIQKIIRPVYNFKAGEMPEP